MKRRKGKDKVVPSYIILTPFVLLIFLLLLIIGGNDGLLDLCHPKCDCLDTVFDCRKRGLTFFPDDFPSWVQTLNVSGNEMNGIEGPSLTKLKDLRVLAVDGNNLTEIPRLEEPLRGLTFLTLSRNNLASFDHEDLDQFPALQELDLSRNRISVISNSSFSSESSNLLVLNLGNNQIELIKDGSFHTLTNLIELILSKNRIRSLTKDLFVKTVKLEKLDLSRNKLETLDSLRFQELSSLQMLNLRRNSLKNLSDAAFYGLDRLQHLYLDGNRIQVVERRWLYGLRSLRTMNLSGNNLERIEENCWDGMEELQLLDLSWNKLLKLSDSSFTGLHGLRQLDLSNNKIFIFGLETFLPLRNLENMDISYNELSWALEDLSGPFRGLGSCKTLNIAANLLQTLHPEALKGLNSLVLLNISSNPVKWLQPETFVKFPSLVIYLNNVTTFICDCHATWLHSRLGKFSGTIPTRTLHKHGRGRHREQQDSILNTIRNSPPQGPICFLPDFLQGKILTDVSLVNLSCSDEAARPKFLKHPLSQTFLKEGNGSLFCVSESHSSALSKVTWLKDLQTLPDNMNTVELKNLDKIEDNGFQQVNSSLSFSNISWTDAGLYQCVSQNIYGVSYSSKANVTVHVFPHFIKRPTNITVRLGSNAKLECGAKGFPPPEIAFQKDGGVDFPAALERRFHVMPSDDSFMILDAHLADMGLYCCSAKNSAGEVKACATLTVYETPRFSTSLKDERVVEGGTTVLECKANGSPRPQIAWSKDNVLVYGGDDNSRIRLKEDGTLLVIKDARPSDTGRYECILSNAVGTARDFLILTVIPSTATDIPWNSSIFIIALSIVVICCVMMAIFVGFMVMYRDKRRPSTDGSLATTLNGPVLTSSGGYNDDNHHDARSGFMSNPLPDVSLHAYSNKDNGSGDGIPFDLDSSGGRQYEFEALIGGQPLRRDGECFSTFGHRKYPSNLSNASSSILGEGNIIFPSRNGRGTLSLLRKVSIPIPPTLSTNGGNDNPVSSSSNTVNDSNFEQDTIPVPRTSPCGSSGRHFAASDDETMSLNNKPRTSVTPEPLVPPFEAEAHHNNHHDPSETSSPSPAANPVININQNHAKIKTSSIQNLHNSKSIPIPEISIENQPIRKSVTTAV